MAIATTKAHVCEDYQPVQPKIAHHPKLHVFKRIFPYYYTIWYINYNFNKGKILPTTAQCSTCINLTSGFRL